MYETRSWQERPTWPFLLAVRSCTRSSQAARSEQARNDTSDNRDCKGFLGKKQHHLVQTFHHFVHFTMGSLIYVNYLPVKTNLLKYISHSNLSRIKFIFLRFNL